MAAARSAGSSYQLLHGRTADGKLAIAGGAAAAGAAGNGVLGTSEQKGSLRIQGLKLPSSWQGLQEVPRGCYIYGQDGRVQQFEFVTEAGCSAEVRNSPVAYRTCNVEQHVENTEAWRSMLASRKHIHLMKESPGVGHPAIQGG